MARVPTLFTAGSLFGGDMDPFLALHREMNCLFDGVLRGGAMLPSPQSSGQTGLLLVPEMELSDTDKTVRIRTELPGVNERDINVSLNGDLLTIRAEKKQQRNEEPEGVHFNERAFGIFQRTLRLPFQINPDEVQARFENGVLSVSLPKAQSQGQSRRIQIQGSEGKAPGNESGDSPADGVGKGQARHTAAWC